MSAKKTYFNWSTGKDAALALHYLLQDPEYNIAYLLTTVNAHYQRVTMHGLRTELMLRQMEAVGLPHGTVALPQSPTNAVYEECLGKKILELKAAGYEYAAFGDIFLEDLKVYREKQLAALDVKPVFPIWKRDTRELIQQFIDLGFKAVVVSHNAALLDESFAGRAVDASFLDDLPDGVDPCGENGEFHTFCYDGPYFKHPVPFRKGEVILREYQHGAQKTGFWFCDLEPVG